MRGEFLAVDGSGWGPAHHGFGTGFQVRPPSLVSKFLVLRAFQIVACRSSVARIPPISSDSGEGINVQWAPPSVVRRMAPTRPTIQQTLSEGAEPVSKSASTPLVCRDQEAPRSFEISTKPARPARHRTFEPGATIKRGLETVTTSIMEVAAVRPAAGPAAGSGGAAAARAAFISFFLLSVWPSGAGPGTFCELALV